VKKQFRFEPITITLMRALACACVMPCLAMQAAQAGQYSVSPLRLDLKASRRLDVLTVMNAADEPLSIQVQLVSWSQHDGEDQYGDTHELLATPPIFKIPAHGQQIIRVALRREADAARELDYRVFVTEVPPPPAKDFSGAQVALRMSLPIFVAPAAPDNAPLRWQARWNDDGSLALSATNPGNAHVKVTDFEVKLAGVDAPLRADVARYVLPQSTVTWTIKSAGNPPHNAALHLHGASDRGQFESDVAYLGP